MSDEALACVQQNAGRFTAEEFFPNAASRDALLRFLKPRPGLYARLSEMHDSGLLGQMFPEFKAISCRVVRDFYHKYTVDEHTLLTIRNLERLVEAAPERRAIRPAARRGRHARAAGAGAAVSRRRQVARRRRSHLESARMARADVRAPPSRRRGARHGRVPGRASPQDVAGGVPPRHRGSRDRPAVRRAGRRRRPAEDAVPDDAGRRRGGQPRNADAVEGRAALAALRRHLQLPHAVLQRRGDRPQSGRDHRASSKGRTGPLGEGDRGVSRRGCRGGICSCSRARPSIGTCGCHAGSAATCSRPGSRRATPPGS